MIADAPPVFECRVVKVHDGDGPYWCANGIKVRAAGVQAPDFASAEPCRTRKPGYACNDRQAERSRKNAVRLIYRKTLRCRKVDTSWSRAVADCTLPDGSSLSCQLIASGAAVKWTKYRVRYGLRRCPL